MVPLARNHRCGLRTPDVNDRYHGVIENLLAIDSLQKKT
jgi:hypothetical protein